VASGADSSRGVVTENFDRIIDAVPYIPSLDGLRALSVLLVVTVHVNQKYLTGKGLLDHLHGGLGVTIFFVLSGFLITLLALREERATGRLGFKAFYIRRAFRLLPLYYLVLLVYVVLVFVVRLDPRITEFEHAMPYYLLYLQEVPMMSVNATPAPFAIAWSLGIEEKFYLLWPALCFGVLIGPWATARRRAIVAAVLGATLLLAPRAFGMSEELGKFPGGYGAILLGCLVAIVAFEPRWRPVLVRGAQWWVPLAGAVGVVLVAGDQRGTAIATAIALPAVLLDLGPFGGLLKSKPMVWIGRRSYGIYLTHQLGLNVARRIIGDRLDGAGAELGVYLLGLGVTLCAVALIYRLIEKPMIDLGRRVAARAQVVVA
jgi:peptidoglycan/LPS O-acetylase OafA/YrhL